MSWSDEAARAFILPREGVRIGPADRDALTKQRNSRIAVPNDIEQLRQEALRVLDEARVTAEAMGRQAWAEGREAGHREGYAQGYEEGRARAVQDLAEQSRTILLQCEEAVARQRWASIAALAEIAAEACAVLYREKMAADPLHAAQVVQRLLEEASPHRVQVVEISPLDLPVVIKAREEWEQAQPDTARIQIIPVAGLKPGACRVLTDAGWLERDWPTELEALVDAWKRDISLESEGRMR